jgi:hypothetical protein
MSPAGNQRISIADIESKLREIGKPVEAGVEQAKNTAVTVAVAVGALVVIAAYAMGKRRGKRKMPVIEIRRI